MSAESGEGEHENAPDTEERMKECDSRGDMGVVEGDGVVNRDQEARAQRYRRELGEEERRHRRGTCVSCCRNHFGRFLGSLEPEGEIHSVI